MAPKMPPDMVTLDRRGLAGVVVERRRRASVSDEALVAPVVGAAQRAVDGGLGAEAGEHEVIDATATQLGVERAAEEPVDAVRRTISTSPASMGEASAGIGMIGRPAVGGSVRAATAPTWRTTTT